MQPSIEIIIPTTASKQRRKSLFEAIDSVSNQCSVNVIPRVILNGNIFNEEVLAKLKARKDIKLHYKEEGSLPKAILLGRSLVESDFFGFLDDDDVLLENSLTVKLREFNCHPESDAVIGNGYIDRFGENILMTPSFSKVRENPLDSLVKKNWLASCGGLFKSSTIGSKNFQDLPKYLEWTAVAYNLVSENKVIRFVDVPTFRVRDSDISLSKEDENVEAVIEFLTKMEKKVAEDDIKKKLKEKLGDAYHLASEEAWKKGDVRKAWVCHFRSMNKSGRLKYLTYTRHLLSQLWSSKKRI